MRRTLSGLAAAIVMIVVSVGSVAASDPVQITVHSANLVAKGAAVDVAFDVVCQPLNESTTFTPDMGSWVRVDQATSKAMTHGSADVYGVDFVCDGVTANMMTVRLIPESIPFRKGEAIVGVRMNLVDYTTWSSQTGETSTTLRVR